MITARAPISSPPHRAAVAIDCVTIALGAREILRDVTLSVAPGEFVAVLGPNGAGKSTLMRAILGLVTLSGGTVQVLGRPPRRARPQVGYLPQRHGYDRATRIRGLDLVTLGLSGARWGVPLALGGAARERRRAERARVQEAIELVGAADYATRPVGDLSGGEQQRLLIAAALVRQPGLLILDEPLDSLDLPNQSAVAALLGRISSTAGVAVLLVAHDVNPLLPHIDRVVYLASGRAMAGPVQEVISTERLSALYGFPVEVLQTRDGRLVVVGQPEAPHRHETRH